MPRVSATAAVSAAADSDIPAVEGGGPSVARPVVGHPSQAEPVRGREQRLRRGADVRGAVMPAHREALGGTGMGVVRVQRATVAQLEVDLRDHDGRA